MKRYLFIRRITLLLGITTALSSYAATPPSANERDVALEIPNDLPPPARALLERTPIEERPALLARFQRDRKQMLMGIPLGLPPALRDRLEAMPPAERQETLARIRRESGIPPMPMLPLPPRDRAGLPPPPPPAFRARIDQMSPIERQAMRDALQGGELTIEEREARRRAMRERFENMTPQQRKQLMEDMSDSMNSVQKRGSDMGAIQSGK